MRSRILITGATGFVGRALVARLVGEGRVQVRAAVRDEWVPGVEGVESAPVGDIGADTDWGPALRNIDLVVHSAARAHVMRERAVDPLEEFRRVNTDATLRLARAAAAAGARRFVFLSSVKVNGEGREQAYRESDPPDPQGPYAVSKREAEDGLREIAAGTGMETVVIRPTLVYGPGVKANFLALMRWLHQGLPLPLGAVTNKRSLVAVDNLTSLITTCLFHPRAANQTFLAGDGEDLATPELLRRLSGALGRPARIFSVPPALLKAGAAMLGKREAASRLCDSLWVDIAKARSLLEWAPPVSVDEGLALAARAYLNAEFPSKACT